MRRPRIIDLRSRAQKREDAIVFVLAFAGVIGMILFWAYELGLYRG